MKNLGKIIIIWSVLAITVWANVHVSVSPKVIIEGDSAKLIITAEGDQVEFPDLTKIGDSDILSQASSSNFTSVNGKITKTKSKSFTFLPTKSMTIEPLNVKIDGTLYQTESLEVKVQKEPSDKVKDFVFDVEVDKTNVYMSEPIKLTYHFKHRIDLDIAEANFNPPSYEGFWTKSAPKEPNKIEGDYNTYEMTYILFPQKNGSLKINPARMSVGLVKPNVRSYFNFERITWKTLYTKEIPIEVKPLPKDAQVYGVFDFEVHVDKKETKANEPVNFTVSIKGEGNVDDIENFVLNINEAVVYADKPIKKTVLQSGRVEGEFSQKFAIVSNRNYQIPSLTFTYFDKNKKESVTKTTAPIDISVEGSMLMEPKTAILEKADSEITEQNKPNIIPQTKKPWLILALTLLSGLIGGFLLGVFVSRSNSVKNSKKVALPIEKRIKSTKNDKELLSVLMPYINKTKKLDIVIKQLEENIYSGTNHTIDKVDLSKNFSSYIHEEKEEEILKV